jgi:hypothetical protein
MFITRVACDANRPGMDMPPCAYLDVLADRPEDIPAAFTKTLAEAGWSTSDDGYHCPRHNPEFTGVPLHLSADYIEPLPGIRIRLTSQGRAQAELLLDKTRYDTDQAADGIWRAKHVSEDWPT